MNIKNYKFYKKLLKLSFIKEIWLFGSIELEEIIKKELI